MIRSHASSFAGLPVLPYTPGMALPEDPAAVAWRLAVEDFEADPEEFAELVATFRKEVPGAAVRALVVGEWGCAYDSPLPVGLLVDAAAEWTGLRAVFLADLVSEECEISWLTHGDITGLLTGYPTLEVLWVRGGTGLRLEPVRHAGLRELRFESGGLPGQVVRAVGESDLPALERLDCWLGRQEYGGDATVGDLGPVLAGAGLPALRHLALANSEIADPTMSAVAAAPVVGRLTVLDLSMGVLTDEGLDALLAGQPLTHLRRLDLSRTYLSDEARQRAVAALPGVEVDVSEPQSVHVYNGREFRFTAVGE
ncbi:STM4015 family protein [Micromonospora cathayae]|uniref:STM4015 family protein n=1 Tax=Micromonospora cathayae TaxID=3028804 RepID=A0ABY7ZN93_9ACTN|nr:STM4015 family protein [Micromonospora sp. HUAS 3]WDZ83444.1 STM4015 family protein [Micromonospora sp. HUAS 3]